jgi:outer membrane receptor protein involved in Fe transport
MVNFKSRSLVAAAWLVLAALSARGQAAPSTVTGVVEDPSGAVIVGARVEFASGNYQVAGQTNSAGQFQLEIAATSGTLSVKAAGFLPFQRPWNHEPQLKLVLHPQFESDYASQHVLVTATRINTALEDSPADSVTLSDDDLASTPAVGLDDALRKVPGFTLFRRSSSRTANPGTQGVSMRGVGASGASRALVLVDEIPLNDPFGGWVYWDRVVRESISDVEVVRGGADASLYGSTAMGGVIQFRTRRPEQTVISAGGSFGSENTPDVSLFAGTRLGPWHGSLATDLFRTNGYIPVPESQRGAVDSPANSRHDLTTVELGRSFGSFSRVFARGSYFDEGRHNGTVIQKNTTRLGDFSTGLNYETKSLGAISARLFGLFESYHQTFSSVKSVASNRDTESLTDDQHVPSQALAGSAQWARPVGRMQTLVAGFEMREVHGSSNDALFKQSVPNGSTLSGGHERTERVFGEDILQLSTKLIANLSLGYDHWSDLNARLIAISTSGVPTLTPYADRSANAINPRASLLYHLGHGTSLTASGYRAFRAPTLNELYRNFTQGNIVTDGNAALRAEHLTGVEAGVRQSLLSDRLNLRATFFWNDITDAIVNVTQTPTTRLKENVARTLSTGINLDGEFRISNTLQIAGGYQFAHAVVSKFTPDPLNPSLVGNWIPEVPHQQFTLQGRYVNPKIVTATVQGTFVGQQFDDDLNQLLLKKFFTVDLYLGRSLGHGVEIFAAAENTFNQRYYTSLSPVPSLGPPLLARIGLRYQFPKR